MAIIKHIIVGEQLDSGEWVSEDTHEVVAGTEGILLISNPPSGCYKIYNVYAEKFGAVYKFVFEHSDIPEP